MADPERKVQPGQRIRIAARTWNKVLDSIAAPNQVVGTSARPIKLPAMESFVANSYIGVDDRPLIVGEAVVLLDGGNPGSAIGVGATTPLNQGMSFAQTESDLYRSPRMYYTTMRPGGPVDQPFAVCIDPAASVFVVAGFCWARVRTLAPWHKYARRCVPQPSDSEEIQAASVGCLDSCGYGPARIIGWASQDSTLGVAGGLGFDGGNGSIYWALIRF